MSQNQTMKRGESLEGSCGYSDDEISLVELWQTLMRRKKIVVSTLVATMLIAMGYLWLTPSIYEAKLRLLLPKDDTLFLSIPSRPYTQFEPKATFQEFQNELRSSNRWKRFVSAHPELFQAGHQDKSEAPYEELPVKFNVDKNFLAEHVLVSYQDKNPLMAADILHAWVKFTEKEYITGLLNQMNVKIQRQRENINNDIAMLRHEAKLKRQDQIARLREDLTIATTLGITDNFLLRCDRGASGTTAIITRNETAPGYLRGIRALNTEIDVLSERKSSDPWISSLPEKQVKLSMLDNLQFIPDKFIPYSLDGGIVAPKYPVQPEKRLIIMLALISGLILGIFSVFFMEFMQNNGIRKSNVL